MSSKQWVGWVHGAENEPTREVPKAPPAGKKRKPKPKVYTAYDLGPGVKGSPVEPSPSPPED